jgi:hypothetical protein
MAMLNNQRVSSLENGKHSTPQESCVNFLVSKYALVIKHGKKKHPPFIDDFPIKT